MYIKAKLNKVIPRLIEKSGQLINPLILNFKSEKNKLLIFYFHGLYESLTQKQLNHSDPQNNITVAQFEEFAKYFLDRKYIFIKEEDLSTNLLPNQRYAMITFDDGYFNNLLAVNILHKYRVPATFFLTTKNIIENKSFWWDVIYRNRMKQNVNEKEIGKEQKYLKSLKYPEINKYIEDRFGKTAFEPWSDIDRPFTKSEIGSFVQNPFVSIGNHTHNHTILSNYTSVEVMDELSISNQVLCELTGKVPVSIAFPNGGFNIPVLEIAEQIGFRFAFTTQNGINKLPIKNKKLICLNRIMAKTESIKSYGSFIRIGYDANSLYHSWKKKVRNS